MNFGMRKAGRGRSVSLPRSGFGSIRKSGRLALEFATHEDLRQGDPELRDQELRSMGEAWAEIDETRSLEVSRVISDPF